ncbi:hypothetical protein MKY07_11210 [Solibacillus sp. FSL W7-1472]|uniref:hypothetical protein n=1 Tax=Solibacillus sp. FSL W7-1472 TaxID=2921707 RepID=UPI0007FB427E|nr:hypothetical protein [Solibacillus silvestris]OBW60175.1 hypothetical protein A9986_03080 [Solibacillus silvestris]
MQASENILKIWNQFKHFPMETLTKAWYAKQDPLKYQRPVELMKEHYRQYKITGNCFDLAIWLLDEFKRNNIEAYAIGHHLFTEDAHIAVIAVDEKKYKYLCDLGDQWIQPIRVDKNSPFSHLEECIGFFPGAKIQVQHQGYDEIEILYKRPNGKISKQVFNLNAIDEKQLLEAAEFSQRLIKPYPLLESRQYENEITHWEFYNFRSYSSSMNGLLEDAKQRTVAEWATIIHEKTNYNFEILLEVLSYYMELHRLNLKS